MSETLAPARPSDADKAKRPAQPIWKPGSHRLEDAWFPIAHSYNVGETPVRRIINGEDYWLWRSRGALRVSQFHPEMAAFDRDPANRFTGGTGEYPSLERYGYVWAWYGNPQAASPDLVPDVPFIPEDGKLPHYMRKTARFDCSTDLSLENLLDLTHADFLHANVVGDEKTDSDEVEVISTSETVTMIRTCTEKTVAPIMRYVGGVRAKTQEVRAVIHVHMRSGVAFAYGRYRPGFDVPVFHPCVPEGANRCRLNVTTAASAAPLIFRFMMAQAAYVVSRQDNLMVRPQTERYLGEEPRPDCHSRFDGAGVRYRFLKQQIADRQAKGDFAYAEDAHPGKSIRGLLGI